MQDREKQSFHGYSAHGDLKSPPLSTQPGSPPMHLEGECWVVPGLGRAWGNQEVKGLAAKKPRHHYQHHRHRTQNQSVKEVQVSREPWKFFILSPFNLPAEHRYILCLHSQWHAPLLWGSLVFNQLWALRVWSVNKQCAGVAANVTCPPSRLLLKNHTEWIELCFYRKSCSYHPPPPPFPPPSPPPDTCCVRI